MSQSYLTRLWIGTDKQVKGEMGRSGWIYKEGLWVIRYNMPLTGTITVRPRTQLRFYVFMKANAHGAFSRPLYLVGELGDVTPPRRERPCWLPMGAVRRSVSRLPRLSNPTLHAVPAPWEQGWQALTRTVLPLFTCTMKQLRA